jgi:hypothetical protein
MIILEQQVISQGMQKLELRIAINWRFWPSFNVGLQILRKIMFRFLCQVSRTFFQRIPLAQSIAQVNFAWPGKLQGGEDCPPF